MFNKYLFGFIEGFGEMLFPDYSHVLTRASKWTATEDCFVVLSHYGNEQYPASSLHIDNVEVAKVVDTSHSWGYVFFSGYVAKGSSLRTGYTMGFTAYALKRGGGVATNDSHFRRYNHA